MAVTGDLTQVDLPTGTPCGLAEAVRVLEGIEGISVVRLNEDDVFRHHLVTRIIRAYDAKDAPRGKRSPRGAGPEDKTEPDSG